MIGILEDKMKSPSLSPGNLIFGVCFILLTMPTNSFGFLVGCSCGTLEPLNPFIFVNETLRMNCTLDESALVPGVTSQDLAISFADDIVSNNTRVVNQSTISLEKVIRSTEEETLYLCFIKNKPDSEGLVDSQYLKVDYRPQNITDFRCMIHDWDAWMNCSWSLPKFKHLPMVELTLTASNNGGTSYHDCPYMSINKTFCLWNHALSTPEFIPVDVFVWYFSLTVRNTVRNVSATSRFTVLPDENVKPAPVENFSVTNVNSSCVSLAWTIRKYRSQIFRLIFKGQNGDSKVSETRVNSSGVTVCGLHASMAYTVSIYRKPSKAGYWSEPETISVVTKEDNSTDQLVIIVTSSVAFCLLAAIAVAIVLFYCRRKSYKGSNPRGEMREMRVVSCSDKSARGEIAEL